MPEFASETEESESNLNESGPLEPNTYLVCTRTDDGTSFFNGERFDYTSRDIWSDGSTTLHLSDGGQFTFPAIGDAFLRAVYITEMCPQPLDPSWGM